MFWVAPKHAITVEKSYAFYYYYNNNNYYYYYYYFDMTCILNWTTV